MHSTHTALPVTFVKLLAARLSLELNQYATERDTSERNLDGGNYVPLPGKCLLRNYYVPDAITSHYINTPFILCMHIDAAIQAYYFTTTQVVDGQVMMLYILSYREVMMLKCSTYTRNMYKC